MFVPFTIIGLGQQILSLQIEKQVFDLAYQLASTYNDAYHNEINFCSSAFCIEGKLFFKNDHLPPM
jgi:hypothetical protein